MEKPIRYALIKHNQPPLLNYHNPIDGFNLYLKISFMAGCIIAAPFVLYQVGAPAFDIIKYENYGATYAFLVRYKF